MDENRRVLPGNGGLAKATGRETKSSTCGNIEPVAGAKILFDLWIPGGVRVENVACGGIFPASSGRLACVRFTFEWLFFP
jgi:hypothetical protein